MNEGTKKMWDSISDDIKDDIGEAIKWAKETLTNHEGSGHQFYITAAYGKDAGMVVCSFAKPAWNADHCSKPMEHGAEAIVMAVCEYLNGE